jgi:hypothetical protein
MTSLPRLIRPMLVSLRRELPADKESYGWELKWDGLRAIAYVSGEEVRLVSRNDKDMAASYPELGVLAERVSTPVILDGEIVTLRDGRPDFGLLQSRMHVQQPDDKLLRRAPVQRGGMGRWVGCSTCCTRARTRRSDCPTRSAGRGWRPSAWTPPRSGPRRSTAAAARRCWPRASRRAWRGWSASR